MAQKKQIPIEIKALSEDGSFEGILAAYNNVDLGNDLIEPGAFKKTIQEKGAQVPLLWQHDPHQPIGTLTLEDGPDALRVKGQLLLDIPQARNAYVLLKAAVIKGLSIGYDTVKAVKEGGVRHLKELRLWEGSVVTFPMNEEAMVTDVKHFKGNGSHMFEALCDELVSIIDSDGEQKADAVRAAVTQYRAAYKAIPEIREENSSSEVKEGRVLSSATKEKMKMAHGHIKSADDIFNALLVDDEADDDSLEDDDTLKSAAAEETKSEPVPDHSAAEAILAQVRALIPQR